MKEIRPVVILVFRPAQLKQTSRIIRLVWFVRDGLVYGMVWNMASLYFTPDLRARSPSIQYHPSTTSESVATRDSFVRLLCLLLRSVRIPFALFSTRDVRSSCMDVKMSRYAHHSISKPYLNLPYFLDLLYRK